MKKKYDRNTMSDMPMDYSFNPSEEKVKVKTIQEKQKINAIGKKANGVAKSNNKTNTKTTTKSSKVQTKTTKKTDDLNDLEKLNEENIKNYRYKTKRNRVVIILLSVMLAIAITTIAVYIGITKLEANCNMVVHGANATVFVNDMELKEFRAPSNLQNDSILVLDIKLRINDSGNFRVRFSPECYQNGILIDNTNIYSLNHDLFYEGGDGSWYSKETISGGKTIALCGGITLDYYAKGLNVDNFKLEFHIYLEKV